MTLSAGHKVGPYEILASIGEGGMGEVWKARDTRLNRIVAIKQLKGEHNVRFQQEARAIAAVNHPHICQIYDVGPDYLVLEFVEGKPIRGPMALEEASELANQIAGALELAHKRGILHRDLKPANILKTESGVKLLDFGLAKLMVNPDSDVTQTSDGMLLGTAAYMSPEQAQGRPVDERSDIFSFGAVLYELLAGARAFPGDTIAQTLSGVLRDDPAPLDSPLTSFIARCLAKDPARRFQNVQEMRGALQRALTKHREQPASNAIDSIAVLPFANNANDPDTEYLCEGIAENIMNSLAQLARLRVTPRSTVFRYKSSDLDPQTIGRELGVRAVLTGRVSQRGDNLLVGTELLDVAAGSQLWGERFYRKISDLFALEEEIAQKISESLRIKLAGDRTSEADISRPAKRFTENAEAYQLNLRARHHWTRRTPEHIRKSAELFQQAIEKDPSYALAYTGLADCYSILAVYSIAPQKESFARAKAAAVAALAFDSDLPEAHSSLGFIRAYFDWDWTGAEAELKRALELNPDLWVARYWYALILSSMGRFDEADVQIARGLELEPLSSVVMHGAMMNSCLAGRYAQTIEEGLRGIENDPHYFLIRHWLGLAYEMAGQHSEAIRQFEKAAELCDRRVSWVTGSLGHAYTTAGDRASAENVLKELLDLEQHGTIDRTGLASVFLGLGDRENALLSLERAAETRGLLAVMIKHDPRYKSLHSEPRFQALLQKVHLA
jgi:serine/threonine protein kinase/Flp pilus assembly protein TadD